MNRMLWPTELRRQMVAGVGFEPHDLRVMSPTSYQTALPRDISCRSWRHQISYTIVDGLSSVFFSLRKFPCSFTARASHIHGAATVGRDFIRILPKALLGDNSSSFMIIAFLRKSRFQPMPSCRAAQSHSAFIWRMQSLAYSFSVSPGLLRAMSALSIPSSDKLYFAVMG